MAPSPSSLAGGRSTAKAAMLAAGGFEAALPLWASIGITLMGAAFGALLIFLASKLKTYLQPETSSEEQEEQKTLLPNSAMPEGDDCTSWQGGSCEPSTKADSPVSWTVLITTLIVSLPSVLGTWCWPLLLVALFPAASGFESDSNREAFHHFTFGVDIVLFTFVVFYIYRMTAASTRNASFVSRWGPLIMVTVACVFLILDPSRHVLLDHGGVFFAERDLAMYSSEGGLSAVGKFCQTISIVGIVLLLAGVMWHMRLPEALLAKLSSDEGIKKPQ